ncbi:hypothetical protein SAMN05216510_3094 [Pseudomonas coleopterorum]|nr:hypothetical protein SAMN05216510_3094 [Pseudomonas coleopterorum]
MATVGSAALYRKNPLRRCYTFTCRLHLAAPVAAVQAASGVGSVRSQCTHHRCPGKAIQDTSSASISNALFKLALARTFWRCISTQS